VLRMFLREEIGLNRLLVSVLTLLPRWRLWVEAARRLPREMQQVAAVAANLARFGSIQSPTLLLVGAGTEAGFKNATNTLNRILPNSAVHVLRGQGHAAAQTAPRVLARAVVSFLESGACT